MDIGGAAISAAIGAASWLLFAFVGTPIRKFWDLRGEVALALNTFARNIPGMPVEEHLLIQALHMMADDKAKLEASKEFRRLGLALLSFWQHETFARANLRIVGLRGDVAGRMLIELATASRGQSELGPRRSELAAALRLKT